MQCFFSCLAPCLLSSQTESYVHMSVRPATSLRVDRVDDIVGFQQLMKFKKQLKVRPFVYASGGLTWYCGNVMFQVAAKPKQMPWTLLFISLYEQKWDSTAFLQL